jgi:hypothetical protein
MLNIKAINTVSGDTAAGIASKKNDRPCCCCQAQLLKSKEQYTAFATKVATTKVVAAARELVGGPHEHAAYELYLQVLFSGYSQLLTKP